MTATEAIVFPQAVQVTIEYLRAQLLTASDGAEVHGTIPKTRPERFVRVLRTGGVRHTLVTDAAQLTLEAWADRDDVAEELAQLARALINAMPGRHTTAPAVYRVEELAGPGALPDEESDQARYTWSVLVHFRGTAL